MGLIAKWKYRLLERKITGVIVHDEETIEITDSLVKESNHLKDPWHDRGYEIQSKPITVILNGKIGSGYVCSAYGITADLKEDFHAEPTGPVGNVLIRWSGVIGKLTSADIIEKGIDLEGGMKKILMGVLIGMALYAIIVGPVITKILS